MNNQPIFYGMYGSVEAWVQRISLFKSRDSNQRPNRSVINTENRDYVSHGVRREHLQETSLSSKSPNLVDANASLSDVEFILLVIVVEEQQVQ